MVALGFFFGDREQRQNIHAMLTLTGIYGTPGRRAYTYRFCKSLSVPKQPKDVYLYRSCPVKTATISIRLRLSPVVLALFIGVWLRDPSISIHVRIRN